jgi:hypothetical protein
MGPAVLVGLLVLNCRDSPPLGQMCQEPGLLIAGGMLDTGLPGEVADVAEGGFADDVD